ncbi:MAG TPA: hypothetical protein VMV89_04555 [Candidatus Paceibacterota bacterium]|nr:hypothetical protein [Candidatus Paceibacterota bacterium]
MNKENINLDDAKLRAHLHSARVSPSLPPRFQENVWRRIEYADAPAKSESWLNALAALVLRPRFALATATVLVVVGALLGVREGNVATNQTAHQQYLAAVAPASIR